MSYSSLYPLVSCLPRHCFLSNRGKKSPKRISVKEKKDQTFDFNLLLSSFPQGECQHRHQETGCCHHRRRSHTPLPCTPLPEEEGQEEGHLTAVGAGQHRVLLLCLCAERYNFLSLAYLFSFFFPPQPAAHWPVISI